MESFYNAINNDEKTGLEEAIYELRLAAGIQIQQGARWLPARRTTC